MSRDIAEATSGTGLGRIGAPGSLFLVARFQSRAEPTLDVVGSDRLDFTQLTVLNHLPSHTDERISGVVVRHCEHCARFGDDVRELFRLSQIKGHRLITDDVEACFESGFGNWEMRMIGSCDGDEVDTLIGFKKVMDGPQDLSFSDIANDSSRTLWQSLGGTVASWYGLNWLKVIRPGLLPLSVLSKTQLGKPLAWAGRPIATLTDRLLRRAAGNYCKVNPLPKGQAEPLTPDLFLQFFPQFGRADDLRPVYDRETIDWVWPRLDFMYRNGGESQQILLRNHRSEPIGWYIYQLSATGIARVSQIVAHPHTAGQVIDHLLNHAAERGAIAVAGRVIPRFIQAISDRHCLILRRSTYLLVHSRDPEIADAFINGRAFLSLLEGEGPLQIWNNPELALQRLPQPVSNQNHVSQPCLS